MSFWVKRFYVFVGDVEATDSRSRVFRFAHAPEPQVPGVQSFEDEPAILDAGSSPAHE